MEKSGIINIYSLFTAATNKNIYVDGIHHVISEHDIINKCAPSRRDQTSVQVRAEE